MGNTTGDTTPTTPFWLKMHSLEYECNMAIDRFQRQPSTDYDNVLSDWAFEASNALETLQKSPDDFLTIIWKGFYQRFFLQKTFPYRSYYNGSKVGHVRFPNGSN